MKNAPKFDECMRLMRKSDPQLQEEGFHALLPLAAEFLPELMEAFRSETDDGLRKWLLELIGEARSPQAMVLLCEQFNSDNEGLRYWAEVGLTSLDTKEARAFLFENKASG